MVIIVLAGFSLLALTSRLVSGWTGFGHGAIHFKNLLLCNVIMQTDSFEQN